jgi:hypothetical protein
MTRPIVVLVPHFAPDTAPTGEVITRIVDEFIAAGQRIHVVTALPWYRTHAIEEGWTGRLIRRECTAWGSIIRVHPFRERARAIFCVAQSVLSVSAQLPVCARCSPAVFIAALLRSSLCRHH